MKTITCDICKTKLKDFNIREHYFTIKIKSPFCDVRDLKAHCCSNCYDILMKTLNRGEDNG